MKKNLKIDCIAVKRKVQAEIYEETKNMSDEEILASRKREIDKSPFGHLFRKGASTRVEKKKQKRA